MKVAGVVVTYNRKNLLTENISALLDQTYKIDIIIIDNNSTDGTYEFLTENGLLSNQYITYIKLEENVGGAGGFAFGTKHAYENGYDFICLMDDDGKPINKYTIEELLEKAQSVYENEKKIMVNSLVIADQYKLSFGLSNEIMNISQAKEKAVNGIIKQKINPFNGTLISKELIQSIGFPNKDFFIKGDENDYMIRANKTKAFIGTVTNSLYYHPALPINFKKILGMSIALKTEAPWKEYYRSRNYTYMYKCARDYKMMFFQPFSQIRSAIFSDCNKKKTIYMICLGFIHGIISKLGKIIDP